MKKVLLILILLCLHGSFALAQSEYFVIVALGNSTSAGSPDFKSPLEHPPEGAGNPKSQYGYWVQKSHPGLKVLNRGVSGERVDQVLKRFKRDVVDVRADRVLVLAGVNDIYQGYRVEWIKRHLIKIYDEADIAGIPVMALTILPYNLTGPHDQARIVEVNQWIQDYTVQKGYGFCDTYQAVVDPNRPGRLIGTRDGIHPDLAVYRKMGKAVSECLDRWLK